MPGLDAIPDDRPILFVGNHQFYALDIGILIEEFLRKRNMLPRGLAHPVIFGVSCCLPEVVHFSCQVSCCAGAVWDCRTNALESMLHVSGTSVPVPIHPILFFGMRLVKISAILILQCLMHHFASQIHVAVIDSHKIEGLDAVLMGPPSPGRERQQTWTLVCDRSCIVAYIVCMHSWTLSKAA